MALGLYLQIPMHERGPRDRIVVQPRNVPQADRKVRCRLAVGSIEGPVFRGMLVDAHGHMEGSLDVRHRASSCTSKASREPPTTVNPLAFAKPITAS